MYFKLSFYFSEKMHLYEFGEWVSLYGLWIIIA